MSKEKIIYTNEDFIVFKNKPTSWVMGNYVGKTLKEIEELEGKEIKKVYRYISKKKTIYDSSKDIVNKALGEENELWNV